MKANGYPDRRTPRPPKTTHAPSGMFSLCGAYFSPTPAADGSLPAVTCRRCIKATDRANKRFKILTDELENT